MALEIEILGFRRKGSSRLPLFTMSVSAGKPVPVDEEIEREIDLNEFLVEHPAATFFARVKGDSMQFAGITDGDILIVDTSLQAVDGKVVVVSVQGEITLKIFRIIDGGEYYESHSGQFLPLGIDNLIDAKMLGVVTKVIHSF
jgi:DNA polymerase V